MRMTGRVWGRGDWVKQGWPEPALLSHLVCSKQVHPCHVRGFFGMAIDPHLVTGLAQEQSIQHQAVSTHDLGVCVCVCMFVLEVTTFQLLRETNRKITILEVALL